MKQKRQFDFADDSGKAAAEAKALARKQLLTARAQKLVSAEKRWLRKLRLATTKIRKIRASMRRVQKERDTL